MYDVIEKYYRENFDRLVKRFTKYYNDKSRAEDVVQEAFCRACLYINNYNPEQEFGSWFNTIANNCGKQNTKQEMRHGAVDYEELPEQEAPDEIIPKVIYNQVVERIEKKDGYVRDILRRVFIDNLSIADVMHLTSQSASNVKRIVFEFRKEIRKDFSWSL